MFHAFYENGSARDDLTLTRQRLWLLVQQRAVTFVFAAKLEYIYSTVISCVVHGSR